MSTLFWNVELEQKHWTSVGEEQPLPCQSARTWGPSGTHEVVLDALLDAGREALRDVSVHCALQRTVVL